VLVSSGKATALIQDEFDNYLLDKNFMVSHFELNLLQFLLTAVNKKIESEYFSNH
jgi:hypothetical protein